jgi:hypothetical protein
MGYWAMGDGAMGRWEMGDGRWADAVLANWAPFSLPARGRGDLRNSEPYELQQVLYKVETAGKLSSCRHDSPPNTSRSRFDRNAWHLGDHGKCSPAHYLQQLRRARGK